MKIKGLERIKQLVSIKSLFNKAVDKLTQTEVNEFVAFDFGARYVKGIFVRDGRVEDAFVEKNKGKRVETAAGLLRKKGLLSKKVKVSLKGQDTLIRYLPFPKVEKSKIKEVLGYELSKYLPFPQGGTYFDAFILDENYSKEDFFVLLAAVKKNSIDLLLKEFREEKMNISEIVLNNVALINLLLHNQKTASNIAIVDLGFSSTLLNLIKKGTPYLSREIKTGVVNLLDKLSVAKSLSIDEIEDWLINSAQEKDILTVMEELFFDLSEEIRNSLDYFEMNAGDRIETVCLTGGGARLKGIVEVIKTALDLEVKLWEHGESLNFKQDKTLSFPPQMMSVVSGLSL